MSVIAWILFGLINGFILNALEQQSHQGSMIGAVVMGMLGALTGGMLAYLVLGGVKIGFNATIMYVLIFEGVLLLFLFLGKTFRRSS